LTKYLIRGIQNELKDEIRKKKADKRGGGIEDVSLDASSNGEEEEEGILLHEKRPSCCLDPLSIVEVEDLWAEIQKKLTEPERSVLQLRFDDPDTTNVNIAREMGVTESTIRWRRKRIEGKLREFLI